DFLVDAGYGRRCDGRLALVRGNRPDAACRWQHERALDHAGPPLLVEERDQRLADAEVLNRLFGVELRIRAHRFRRGLDRFLVARRESAQRMLDAIAELSQ